MKLKVLIPSEEYKNYAGARIRYGRLALELEHHGVMLQLEDIGAFMPETDDSDAILISKCHDARALVAAAGAYARGQLVGVDLFDDYFSQTADSRLLRYRKWLAQLLQTSKFALCSTPKLARVVEKYRADLPIHVVNDPAPVTNEAELPQLLESKLSKAKDELKVRLAWFGVGDNPHFPVGLSDIAAFSGMLHRLSNSVNVAVELTVLTNARALTADGLALIQEASIQTRVEEWTEAREREILHEAFACFLPVNAQPFSAAKSLNRAVTALSAGCQVISAGYPLYAPLEDIIYRDIASFAADMSRGSMKFSAKTVDRFEARKEAVASPAQEAMRLAEFLGGLETVLPEKLGLLALIHGQATSGAAHKAVRALGGLSVGSPYCGSALGFDVIFRPVGNHLAMLVSDQAAKRLLPSVKKGLKPFNGSESKLWLVPGAPGTDVVASRPSAWHEAPLPFQLATYEKTMTRVIQRMEEAFGSCRTFISESSPLPFSLSI